MVMSKLLIATLVAIATGTSAAKCAAFPPSMIQYSSIFKQPKPPSVQPEFTENFVQHK